jgi:putative Holliday junction resolvase
MSRAQQKQPIAGPVLALDLGQKLVGAAVSDELLISIKRLEALERSNWKQLLTDVRALIRRFDAQTVVLGLPLRLDGTLGDAAQEVHQLARNFSLSLSVPVLLQDERLSTVEARDILLAEGHNEEEIGTLIDSTAAAVILHDFLSQQSSSNKEQSTSQD